MSEDQLLQAILAVMGTLHQVVVDNKGGYNSLDSDYQIWFNSHNLRPIKIVDLAEVPDKHAGKVYCWLFDPADANSNFFFKDSTMAILFKLTFGGV